MIRACVVGWPVAHSRSPIIHGHWLRTYGINGAYTKEAVAAVAARDFLRGLRAAGYAGCNVTIPHKETAFAVADERDASAEAVGAANTVWHDANRLHVSNTDTYGFMAHLGATWPAWPERDAPVLILGAGGAARAIAFGFLEAGVSRVRVANRTRARADALAAHFGTRVTTVDWSDRHRDLEDFAMLVNTVPLGDGTQDILDLRRLSADCIVCDIVYVPLETPLLAAARARGLRTLDGLGMLLHQAVPGFERWFGVRPEVTQDLYDLVAADIGRALC